jgi:hypothetical protein
MQKKADKSEKFIQERMEEFQKTREKIAEVEKKDLPHRMAELENLNADFRSGKKYMITILNSRPTKETRKFYPPAKESLKLMVEMDNRIIEGLRQLRTDEDKAKYRGSTTLRIGLYNNEWADTLEKLSPDELIKQRIKWLENDIRFNEKDIKMIGRHEEMLDSREQARQKKLRDHVEGMRLE